MSDLRYPIGKFQIVGETSPEELQRWVEEIAEAPSRLRDAVGGLGTHQLDTPYRDGGWTVRQVVHHLPDSHLNAYVRCKLALTEDEPMVKTYEEARWAELTDSVFGDIEMSLQLFAALHERWAFLLRSLTPEQWNRRYLHPEMKSVPLHRIVGMYAWHGKHHVAHIVSLRERMYW